MATAAMASLSMAACCSAALPSSSCRGTPCKFASSFDCARSEFSNGARISTFGRRPAAACGPAGSSSFQLKLTSSTGDGLLQAGTCANEGRTRISTKGRLVVCAALPDGEEIKSRGLTYDGPGQGGQWLSSTTRHARIYIGVADPETGAMDQQQLDKITLMLDTDDEFIWPQDKLQKVYDYFAELVDAYAGAPCTEYTLRLIGSDIEHYIRKLLLANEIKYNLDCRVLNFSMGKPYYNPAFIEEASES